MNLVSELGEQTLNHIAKVALYQAKKLDIRVKTDPGTLMQGQLNSFFANASGLAIRSELRMESFTARVVCRHPTHRIRGTDGGF